MHLCVYVYVGGWVGVHAAIDVWSVGCIMAELLGGKVLFPGKDYVHQMGLIINVLGTPSQETLSRIGSPRAQEWIRSIPRKDKVPFTKIFPDADPKGKRPQHRVSVVRRGRGWSSCVGSAGMGADAADGGPIPTHSHQLAGAPVGL
jgi:serine/threonine protein kinase